MVDGDDFGSTGALLAGDSMANDPSLFDVESVAPVEGEDAPVLVGSYRSKISVNDVIPSQIPS